MRKSCSKDKCAKLILKFYNHAWLGVSNFHIFLTEIFLQINFNQWFFSVLSAIYNWFNCFVEFGRYIYLETSSRKPNDTARLISTDIPATGDTGGKCLTFWYHMYGPHVNSLNIYVLIGGHTGKPLWSRTGTQGNKWIKGQVTLIGRQPFKVNQ